ncbi:hypothetical protein VIGAN_01523400 [Vigna angularis var. angularis]|uniref:60S ribosome subunit biogenesis protein NIP7 pre-PUA domain-containing protein n=1 Tax=Vigna angularis var. angularis TaxID=157739 RepID=A0A0S3R947_PHAAN|nr:hypothetical protein VIGAN_01523400 [Vigna angularis var. angularis]
MRPLDEKETSVVFEKLFKFVGNNLKNIVENPSHEGPDANPGRYCFRLHKNKIYYASESLVKRATNVARPNLVSLGTCIGKYTHGGSFHLTVQALNLLAANAKHKNHGQHCLRRRSCCIFHGGCAVGFRYRRKVYAGLQEVGSQWHRCSAPGRCGRVLEDGG